MPRGSLALVMWMMGSQQGKRGLVCPEGGGGWLVLVYINNFHFPSAAVCIAQHGSVVMAIATGQMMQKWVHLVMNLRSADGCWNMVHFTTILNTEPSRGHIAPPAHCSWRTNLNQWQCKSSCRGVVSVTRSKEPIQGVHQDVWRWSRWDGASGVYKIYNLYFFCCVSCRVRWITQTSHWG